MLFKSHQAEFDIIFQSPCFHLLVISKVWPRVIYLGKICDLSQPQILQEHLIFFTSFWILGVFFIYILVYCLAEVTSFHTIFIPRKAGYCNHLRVSVCLFVCLFVSRISHKLQVGFWRNLVSREVMIIGRRSSKLGVIRIEIRIWDPDNCFSWTTGRIFGSGFQSHPG